MEFKGALHNIPAFGGCDNYAEQLIVGPCAAQLLIEPGTPLVVPAVRKHCFNAHCEDDGRERNELESGRVRGSLRCDSF